MVPTFRGNRVSMVTRAELRTQTLLRLSAAAVALFEEKGLDATIDAIAKRAEVSRRTVFRYVQAKEELAYVHPMLWLGVFNEAVARYGDGTARDRICAGCRAVAEHIDRDPGPPRRSFLVTLAHPRLLMGFNGIFQKWIERIAEVATTDPSDPTDRVRARVLGSAVMGVVDGTTRQWLFQSEDASYSDLFFEYFTILDALFEA